MLNEIRSESTSSSRAFFLHTLWKVTDIGKVTIFLNAHRNLTELLSRNFFKATNFFNMRVRVVAEKMVLPEYVHWKNQSPEKPSEKMTNSYPVIKPVISHRLAHICQVYCLP